MNIKRAVRDGGRQGELTSLTLLGRFSGGRSNDDDDGLNARTRMR